jgi:hypothetical protein
MSKLLLPFLAVVALVAGPAALPAWALPAGPAARGFSPLVRVDRVRPGQTDVWTLQLQAGVSYRVVVDGDGDTDLDGYLRDENDNLIDADDDLTDYVVLRVTPRWSGPFTLRVVNRGSVSNVYRLTVAP